MLQADRLRNVYGVVLRDAGRRAALTTTRPDSPTEFGAVKVAEHEAVALRLFSSVEQGSVHEDALSYGLTFDDYRTDGGGCF